ncbi:hypothetical protein KP806_18455 [Paenibacillus sp. N4]|uniref:hypothetical protein n=1 Tax=Paenibacillus vietnamensis TaxID=2590547 RepID=UPI001CD0DA32|nr:hypothetical protein [Paenibacillus vietnamensis]MCA0757047.1 hypothetical protein [Paenibacillus vietnamensis]
MVDDKKGYEESLLAAIEFYQNNVVNISEATRQNKLAAILEDYANEGRDAQLFVIQNSKKKEASGVLMSIDRYTSLVKENAAVNKENDYLKEKIIELELVLKTLQRESQDTYSVEAALAKLDLNDDDLMEILSNDVEVEID